MQEEMDKSAEVRQFRLEMPDADECVHLPPAVHAISSPELCSKTPFSFIYSNASAHCPALCKFSALLAISGATVGVIVEAAQA